VRTRVQPAGRRPSPAHRQDARRLVLHPGGVTRGDTYATLRLDAPLGATLRALADRCAAAPAPV
ncbi:hypothetical protein ACWEOR_31525, partial [Micromonospora chalcea]